MNDQSSLSRFINHEATAGFALVAAAAAALVGVISTTNRLAGASDNSALHSPTERGSRMPLPTATPTRRSVAGHVPDCASTSRRTVRESSTRWAVMVCVYSGLNISVSKPSCTIRR